MNVDDGDDEDFDSMGNHIYMELQSTVAFKEVDIDQMLQHTSMDDFLRGLYVRAVNTPTDASGKPMTQHDRLLAQLMETREESRDDSDKKGLNRPKLEFEEGGSSQADDKDSVDRYRGDNLRLQAINNLRERRQRQKQSEIFNKQEQFKKA